MRRQWALIASSLVTSAPGRSPDGPSRGWARRPAPDAQSESRRGWAKSSGWPKICVSITGRLLALLSRSVTSPVALAQQQRIYRDTVTGIGPHYIAIEIDRWHAEHLNGGRRREIERIEKGAGFTPVVVTGPLLNNRYCSPALTIGQPRSRRNSQTHRACWQPPALRNGPAGFTHARQHGAR